MSAVPKLKLATVKEQIATKTTRRTRAKNTKNTHGVNQARVYVQNIPANEIRREYNIYHRTRANARNQSIRKSQRCISNTLQRRQCKKRTSRTPMARNRGHS